MRSGWWGHHLNTFKGILVMRGFRFYLLFDWEITADRWGVGAKGQKRD